MDEMLRGILLGTVVFCFVGIVALACCLIVALVKRHSLNQLYDDSARDFRFVCELLRLYTRKDNIIKNPCLLRSYGDISPRADALVVGGGGVMILTVVDEPGQFSAPAAGNWTVWQEGEAKRIPNAFLPGKQYTSVISSILMKNGLSCPIINVVVLTDDHAKVDSLHEANVLTGDRLVPCVREFNRRRALGKSGQAKLKKALKQHHEQCQRKLSTAMADTMTGDAIDAFTNTGEFSPIVSEREEASVSAEENIARKLAVQSIFANADESESAVTDEAEAEAVDERSIGVFEEDSTIAAEVNEEAGDEQIGDVASVDESADEAYADEAGADEVDENEESAELSISLDGLQDAEENAGEEGSVGDILEALLRSLEAERNASENADSDQ